MVAFRMGRKTYAFSAFTYEPNSGILQRNSRRLRMPPQTSLLLSILLEKAGSVVTREEIQQALWPGGEYLDYEHAINRAVNSLRMVLRDDAQKARFIETFPKRGYRFMASVTLVIPSPGESLDLPLDQSLDRMQASASEVPLPLSSDIFDMQPPLLVLESASLPGLKPALESVAGRQIALAALPQSTEPITLPARAAGYRLLLWVVSLLLLASCVLTFYLLPRRQAPSPVTAIGILPFEAKDPDGEELAQSFRLELMDSLSQLPGVQLRGSQSLQSIKRDADTVALAKELHLDLLLLGKVTVRAGQCTLAFELVRASDAVHLASLQYSGSEEELATIRDKVQRDVFSNLQASRKPVQEFRGSTQNPEAYSEYLRARANVHEHTKESVDSALHQYASAISHDPHFARAYAGMATAYVANYYYTNSVEDQRRAQDAARRALQLDPDLGEAHAALGIVAYRRDWDFSKGEAELRRALQIEPHQAAYHASLAQLLAGRGEFAQSLAQIDLAHADDPLWPQVYSMEGPVAGAARDYARALKAAQRLVELLPDSSDAQDDLAWAYFEAGRFEEAIHSWHTMASMEKDGARILFEDRSLAAYKAGGVRELAALRLQASTKAHNPAALRHGNDFVPAEWYAFTGDKDRAIATLQKESSQELEEMQLAVNPMLENLHSDPRFLKLLAQLGLKLPASSPHVT